MRASHREIMESYEGRGRARLWAEGLAEEARAALAARLAPARRAAPLRFVIFAQGRTGSTLLTSSLDSHPGVRCADEILRRPRRAPVAYAENRALACGAPAFGFHVKCYQLTRLQRQDDWAGFLQAMNGRGWKIVYLKRQNVVRHVFSGLFAEASGRFHHRAASGARPDGLAVEPARLLDWIAERERLLADEQAALGDLPRFELTYERDLQDPERRADRLAALQRFLGLAPSPLTTPLSKSVNQPLSQLVSNFGEVQAALAGTPYEAQLGEPEMPARARQDTQRP